MFHLSPAWNGLHSLVVHFLLILLLVAPLLVIVGITVSAAKRRLFLGSALTLMVLGTGMAYLAVATGELAVKGVISTPSFNDLLNEHQSLAKTTLELFSALTLGFAALFFSPKLLGRDLEAWVRTSLFTAFLLFYGTGAVLLIDTTLKGGRLVHMLGTKTAETSILPHKGGR
jgi:uncharacterized membrane protein